MAKINFGSNIETGVAPSPSIPEGQQGGQEQAQGADLSVQEREPQQQSQPSVRPRQLVFGTGQSQQEQQDRDYSSVFREQEEVNAKSAQEDREQSAFDEQRSVVAERAKPEERPAENAPEAAPATNETQQPAPVQDQQQEQEPAEPVGGRTDKIQRANQLAFEQNQARTPMGSFASFGKPSSNNRFRGETQEQLRDRASVAMQSSSGNVYNAMVVSGNRPAEARPPAAKAPKPYSDTGIMDAMPKPVPEESRVSLSSSQFESTKRKNKAESKSAGRSGMGNGLYGDMTDDSSIDLDTVSVGTRELVKSMREPTSNIIGIINAHSDEQYTYDSLPADDDMLAKIAMDVFNNNDIELLVTKYPDPDEASSHVKKIKAHHGRNMRVHPLVSKVFNADFDGDAMKISLDENLAKNASGLSIDFFIAPDGGVRIDPDFFQLVMWGDERMTSDLLMSEKLDGSGILDAYGLTRKTVANIARDMIEIVDSDQSDESWKRFIMDLRAIDRGTSSTSVSILKDIYNFNADIRMIQGYEMGIHLDDSAFLPITDSTGKIEIPDEIVPRKGDIPANIADLSVALGGPVGQVSGKNPQFRFVSGIAKTVKSLYNTVIGKSSWNSVSSWKNTADEMYAKAMSSRATLGDRQIVLSSWMRSRVAQEVGFPRSDGDEFVAYVDRFIAVYNRYAYLINTSATKINSDYTVDRSKFEDAVTVPYIDETAEGIDFEGFRSQFSKVFADFTLETVFGDAVSRGYMRAFKDMTVVEWTRYMNYHNTYIQTKLSSSPRRSTLIESLNDMKGSFAVNFGVQLDNVIGKLFNGNNGRNILYDRLIEKRRTGSRKLDEEIEVLINAMYMLGPDAFYSLKLDNPSTWVNSDLGHSFVNANSVDQIKALVYRTVAMYRMKRPLAINKEISKAVSDEKIGIANDLKHELDCELNAIMSISGTWKALIVDYRSGGANWSKFLQRHNEYDSMGFDSKNAIEDLLFNDSIGSSDIDSILSVFQYETANGSSEIKPSMIASEIMGNPKGIHAGTRYLTDLGHGQLMDNLNAASDLIDSMSKSNYSKMKKDVDNAFKRFYKSGELQSWLDSIANHHSHIVIDNGMVVDALISTIDPTYASSEKASQEPAMNAFFGAMMLQRNGGTFSDLAVCDDFFIGKISKDRFQKWTLGIAKILADPDYSITVYDDNGNEFVASRESLCGGNDINDVWMFLRDNPRVAMALRRHTVSSFGNKGNAVLSAIDNLYHTLDNGSGSTMIDDDIKYAMFDHPGFMAAVSMMVPISGKRGIRVRNEYSNSVDQLIAWLKYAASKDNPFVYINEYLSANADSFKGMYEGTADDVESSYGGIFGKDQILDNMISNLSSYAMEIKDMGYEDTGNVKMPVFRFDDKSNVYNYFNVIQAFSGAKTSLSTSINGAESQRNGLLVFLAQYVPTENCDSSDDIATVLMLDSVDENGDPDELDFYSNWEKYERRMTTVGIPLIEQNLDKIIEAYPDGRILIEDPAQCKSAVPCLKHRMWDESTNQNKFTQTTAVSRYITIQRSDSTEKNNLKVKKSGIDGKDSVTKFSIFDDDRWFAIQGTIEDLIVNQGMDGVAPARRFLASELKKKNDEMGYTNLSESDYLNIAHMMIRPPHQDANGDIVVDIMSIEQIAAMIRSELINHYATSRKLTFGDAVDASVGIYNGFVNDSQAFDVEGLLSGVKVRKQSGYYSSIPYKHSSSQERNTVEMNKILKSLPGFRYSKSELSEFSDRMRTEHNHEADFVEKYVGQTIDPTRRKADPTSNYDFTGYIGDSETSEFLMYPGPTSAWIIGEDATHDSIVNAMGNAYNLGVTVFVPNPSDTTMQALADADCLQRAIWIDEGYIIPFFDIRVNEPDRLDMDGSFNVGEFYYDPSNVVRMVEDEFNEFRLGDASMMAFDNLTDRIHIWKDGEYTLTARQMFYNFLDRYAPEYLRFGIDDGTKQINFRIATNAEVQQFIVNQKSDGIVLDFGDKDLHDPGVADKFEHKLYEFIDAFNSADPDNTQLRSISIKKDAKPDQIIGWMIARVGDAEAWHPITFYDIERSIGSTSDMTINVDGVYWDESTSTLRIPWHHEGSIEGNDFKMFEGGFGTNKFKVTSAKPKNGSERRLVNGQLLDCAVSAKSTASRRVLIKRMQTMATMVQEARMGSLGYNLGECDGTFPGNPEIKSLLAKGRVSFDQWADIINSSVDRIGYFPFFDDGVFGGETDVMNAFLTDMANRAIRYGINPTNVFISRIGDTPTNIGFDYRVLFDSSPLYMDRLMKFMNYMNPNICTAGINGEYQIGQMFRCDPTDSYSLKTLVPHFDPKGRKFYWWDTLISSFFYLDEHYSGFSAPHVNSSIISMSTLNTKAYGGLAIPDRYMRAYMDWGGIGYGLSHLPILVQPDDGNIQGDESVTLRDVNADASDAASNR